MKGLFQFTKIVDKISDIVGKISMYISIILLFVIMFEIVSRRFFNSPTLWTYETTSMLFGLYIIMIMPYGILHEVNVAVDIFTEKLNDKTKDILSLVTYILFFIPFMAVIFFAGMKLAATSWRMLETSWSVWAPPLYPIKTVIPLGAGLCLLQGLSEMLKRVMSLFGQDKTGKEKVPNG